MEIFTEDERVNYYVGVIQPITMHSKNFLTEVKYDEYFVFTPKTIHDSRYIQDLKSHFSHLSNYKVLAQIGDDLTKENNPSFAKVRKLYGDNRILLNINTIRHWGPIESAKKQDIPFEAKNNKLVWRGNLNINKRLRLKEYLNRITNQDIDIKHALNHTFADYMTIENMLKSKFLLSVEGNDVSTNLKWALLSNSCVLMPKPTCCSWLMEDKLIPGYHYVQIEKDFSDLEDKYYWCLHNLDKCKDIAANATKYLNQFLDTEKEKRITQKVIQKYMENITIL